MYESLKQWIDVDVQVKPFISTDGTGDVLFGDAYNCKCYPKGDITVVRNNVGTEVVSNTQLYIDGTNEVHALDVIVFEGKEYDVQAISTYYRNGKPDIKVVYL